MELTPDAVYRSLTVTTVLILVTVVFSVRWLYNCNMRTSDFPPGPPTLPLLGNIHQMPTKYPFLTYTEWSKKYGDIIGLKVGPLNMVILNSPTVIQSLFVNRASIYSGRPVPYLLRNFIYPGQEQALMFQNDNKLKRMRTSMKVLTGPAGLRHALPMQDRVASKLIDHLRDHTYSAATCIGLWSFETAITATLGPAGTEKAKLEVFERWRDIQHQLLDAIESVVSLIYDIVPAIRYSPVKPGKASAQAIGKGLQDLYMGSMFSLKRHMSLEENAGTSIEYWGMIATILRSRENGETGGKHRDAENDDSRYTEASLVDLAEFTTDAATDTTASTALSLILIFAANGDVLRKAQAEIDQRCSQESKEGPTYSDIGKLPYLKACILETLRWRNPAPLLLPHRMEKDDVFQGYHLPRDTIVMANIWGVCHDPKYYKNPDVFDPERFMEDNPSGIPFLPFGLGRRVCPGDQFAMNSLMIVFSKLLWTFDLEMDGSALDLSLEGGYHTGVIPSPKSLPVRFIPRHA